jgi:hypothetical protein
VQLVLPEPANVPTGQAVHAVAPTAVLNVPGAQAWQGDTPVAEAEPAVHWVGGTLWPL